jgi:hypothetical protein
LHDTYDGSIGEKRIKEREELGGDKDSERKREETQTKEGGKESTNTRSQLLL